MVICNNCKHAAYKPIFITLGYEELPYPILECKGCGYWHMSDLASAVYYAEYRGPYHTYVARAKNVLKEQ